MTPDPSANPTAVPLPLGRLAGVGLIVFFANAALLVLQLVAGRLLAPFVGSSLETWTSVIGVFLTGIALGNALGGKLADRLPAPRTLGKVLLAGAAAALWMVAFPMLLTAGDVYKSIPLGPRIPLLAIGLCLPAGFVLSLLTPLAIKLGLPDVAHTGRVAGMIFALSTLGCLIGNYVTGFYLMKAFTINELVYISAGSLVLLAGWALVGLSNPFPSLALEAAMEKIQPPPSLEGTGVGESSSATNTHAFSDIRVAYLVVFLASFGGMTLEITASRVLAQYLGVSLFTWTGIIGVMLAGTALGNLTGGLIADRVSRPGSSLAPRPVLAATLICAGAATIFMFVSLALVQRFGYFAELDPINRVMAWTFSLFFLPMLVLGMVSPQVIRLAVPDVAHVGRVAGRVYAWSTTGAIVGTFVAGYFLLSTLGMNQTLLVVAAILTGTSTLVARAWDDNILLYMFSIVLGAVTGGFILTARGPTGDFDLVVQHESNYYTIKVTHERERKPDGHGGYVKDEQGNELYERTGRLKLTLDHLLHSTVDPENPGYLHYAHEYVQMEFLRGARAHTEHPRVLVIGGGGYTYPRYAMEMLPETRMDVVEIDPGVTRVARGYLGLKDYDGLQIIHMDGRQFLAEKVPPGTYDLIIQDAVNDLSVPSHLLTKEYNEAVKKALKPNGVYLLTVIDVIKYGQIWKAAMHTLAQSFPAENVCLFLPEPLKQEDIAARHVYVISASQQPLNIDALERANREQTKGKAMFHIFQVNPEVLKPYLDAPPRIILTDQYAPTDNLMADVFRNR
jgi:spermidine synthase/MFS family permease